MFWDLTVSQFILLSKRWENNEYRNNYRAAMVVSAIYNVNRDPKKRKKPYTPDEILGVKKEEEKRDMLETAKQWVAVKEGED